MTYNADNIFAKILRGEISCKKIYEDEDVFSFNDIHPKAKKHVLVITKKPYISYENFINTSSEGEVERFFKKVNFIATEVLNLSDNFKLLINNGASSGQVIFHFHVHILS